MKMLAIGFTVAVGVLITYVTWVDPESIAWATFVVVAMTLIALIWYTFDTHTIARITSDRWTREGVLAAGYSLELVGEPGDEGRTLLRLTNPTTLVVKAHVSCNFRIYGAPVTGPDPLYDGQEQWLLFPQQTTQGWFEIESLLQKKGKTVPIICGERTPNNRAEQLTMEFALEFQDEYGVLRKLPARHHYFDFVRWRWIPSLSGKAPGTNS